MVSLAAVVLTGCTCLPAAHETRGSTCRRGSAECPIDVDFGRSAEADEIVIRGTLTPQAPDVHYRFVTRAPARLAWTFGGSAVHLVLTGPDGDAQGPGLPAVLDLPRAGHYVLSLSANTMADEAYGAFVLHLRLFRQ